MRWPDSFPKDCPPDDAFGGELKAFRLVCNNPPTREDFLSWQEAKPERDFGNKQCSASGVSLLTDYDEAVTLADIAWARRQPKKIIAAGTTTPTCGVVKHTPSSSRTSHITYWLFIDAHPERDFKVI